MRGQTLRQVCDSEGSLSQSVVRLKRHRGLATRYDKLAVRYQATIHVAAINEWL